MVIVNSILRSFQYLAHLCVNFWHFSDYVDDEDEMLQRVIEMSLKEQYFNGGDNFQ